MITTWRACAALNAVLLIASAVGCGDEGGGGGGGCSEPPKKEEQQAGGGMSGATGGGSGSSDLTTDRKGRVPKAYQRPSTEGPKSDRTIKKPVIAVSTATAVVPRSTQVRVTKRNIDGVSDRVEVACRMIAVSPDGKCSGAKNYEEIKKRCCPDGLVETCRITMRGILLVGRGCDPDAKP